MKYRFYPSADQKPVAIFGFGVSGQGAVALLRKHDIAYAVYDEQGGESVVDAKRCRLE